MVLFLKARLNKVETLEGLQPQKVVASPTAKQTSIRLSLKGAAIQSALAEALGITKSAVIEQALRALAARHQINPIVKERQ